MDRQNGPAPDGLDRLAGELYQAASKPELWPSALDQVGDAMGGAVLVASLHRPSGMALLVTHRLDPARDEILRSQYSTPVTNPLFAAMPSLPVMQPVRREGVMADPEYLSCDLYNDVFRDQGVVHAALCCLSRTNAVTSPCGLLRRRGREFDTRHMNIYRRIAPHLHRAMELTVRISDLERALGHAETAANAGSDGLIVADAAGRVAYGNAVAERILREGDGLTCRNGILGALRPDEQQVLRHLVAAAALRFDSLGGNIRISRPGGRAAWALVITPTPPAIARIAGTGTSAALLRVIDLDARPVAPHARLMQIFGFTRAEAEIAVGLMEGESLEGIAERKSVRISTVRTQMRSIYAKAEVARQSDLIRLLLQVAEPTHCGRLGVRD